MTIGDEGVASICMGQEHDWRWDGWPLTNVKASARWCERCSHREIESPAVNDSFHCESCGSTFIDNPHHTDDGYWLCDPCWKDLTAEGD